MDATRDKVRETLPVITAKLFKGDNRHKDVRVGCDKADERLEVELRVKKLGIVASARKKNKSYISETFSDTLSVSQSVSFM